MASAKALPGTIPFVGLAGSTGAAGLFGSGSSRGGFPNTPKFANALVEVDGWLLAALLYTRISPRSLVDIIYIPKEGHLVVKVGRSVEYKLLYNVLSNRDATRSTESLAAVNGN